MTSALTGRKILIITTNFGTETDEIQRPLADLLLFGELKEGGEAQVDVQDGEFTFVHQPAAAKATKKTRKS